MDWLKKKLDPKKPKPQGHVLGTSMKREAVYAVTFAQQTLGFKIGKDEIDGMAIVVGLTPNGEASKHQVGIGDRIVAIDGNKMQSHEAVMQIVPALDRPITLHFLRASSITRKPVGALNKAKSKMGIATSSTAARPLSNTERAAQREQRLAALEARENKWDKKIATGRAATYHKNKIEDNRELGVEGREKTEEEKARGAQIAAEAKAHEAATAAALGYNPYEVTKSGADASRAAIAVIRSGAGAGATQGALPSSAHTPSLPMPGTVAAPVSHAQQQQQQQQPALVPARLSEDEELAKAMALSMDMSLQDSSSSSGGNASLMEAFATLRSQPEFDAYKATKIVHKLLENLQENPTEEKFKKIKLSNKVIQSKVVAVPGAVDILVAAGFVSVPQEDGEQTLVYFGDTDLRLAGLVDEVKLLLDSLAASADARPV